MNINIIDYIIKNTELRQVDIADNLGVSRAQVSKWKKGESIPFPRREELTKLAGLFGDDPQWAVFSGTKKRSDDWCNYFRKMNDLGECQYIEHMFVDMAEVYVPSILSSLLEVGVKVPSEVPLLDVGEDDEDVFSDLILVYLEKFDVLVRWINQHGLQELEGEGICDFWGEAEAYAIEVALLSIHPSYLELTGVEKAQLDGFDQKVRLRTKAMIAKYCGLLSQQGIPFATNYFDLVNKNADELQDELEMITWSSADSVDEFFPYKDRKILAELSETKALVNNLIEKVEALSRL